jgi:hypothetical protein
MLSSARERLRQHRLRAAALTVVGIIAIAGLVDFLTGVQQLSAYSDDWRDVSQFRGALEKAGYPTSSIVSTPLIVDSSEGVPPDGRVLVIMGVERPYLPNELDAIVRFVSEGGCLLLSDDFGYGNPLATRFSLGFSQRRLYSDSFDRNPSFPKLNASMAGNRYTLIADRPCALERVSDQEVDAWTSVDTWMDEDGDGERDYSEQSNPYPVVAHRGYHNGMVVICSDPGLFINDMWGRADNFNFFMDYLGRYFPQARRFIFDETRHKPDHLREGGWRTGMMLEVLTLNNIWGKATLAVLALLAVFSGALLVRPPAEWRHEDTLGEISLHHLSSARFKAEDRGRLRAALLEKVRISLSLHPDEFAAIEPERLREVIADGRLEPLVDKPNSVSLDDMDWLTDLVRDWRRR